ncbi:MAG TPA: YihY/virulence factor BrkB family protein [Terriglobales bacterium]|nr:YihY/virulence factor BrkB family protein [Terriglobales bacterium]
MKSVRELPESWRRFWPHFRSSVVETAKLIGPSARLLTTTEAHTYAYSVSANFLLASLPFLFLLLWVANQLLPSLGATQQHVIGQLVVSYLPAGQERLVADATRLAHRHTVQVFSFVMLAISSSGVFLPLEVALNSIWGFKRNRGYVRNQVVSLALVLGCGAIAYASVVLASLGNALAVTLFPASWTVAIAGLSWLFLNLSSVPAAVAVFFLIYWLLPNGKVPAAQVLPAAIYAGLLAEVFKTVFPWLLPFLDFTTVYATLALPVTLLVWGYCGALLLLFGASLSARGVARLPSLGARLGRVAKSAHGG